MAERNLTFDCRKLGERPVCPRFPRFPDGGTRFQDSRMSPTTQPPWVRSNWYVCIVNENVNFRHSEFGQTISMYLNIRQFTEGPIVKLKLPSLKFGSVMVVSRSQNGHVQRNGIALYFSALLSRLASGECVRSSRCSLGAGNEPTLGVRCCLRR